jgi:hypothetical protein
LKDGSWGMGFRRRIDEVKKFLKIFLKPWGKIFLS